MNPSFITRLPGVVVLLAMSLSPSIADAQDAALFTETFGVVRGEWYRGEPVLLRYTKCNDSAEPVEITCGGCFASLGFRILDDQGAEVATWSPGGCAGVCRYEYWEPRECRHADFEWPQRDGDYPLSPGSPVSPGHYSVTERFGYELPPGRRSFEILAAVAPIPAMGLAGALGLVLGMTMLAIKGTRRRGSAE